MKRGKSTGDLSSG